MGKAPYVRSHVLKRLSRLPYSETSTPGRRANQIVSGSALSPAARRPRAPNSARLRPYRQGGAPRRAMRHYYIKCLLPRRSTGCVVYSPAILLATPLRQSVFFSRRVQFDQPTSVSPFLAEYQPRWVLQKAPRAITTCPTSKRIWTPTLRRTTARRRKSPLSNLLLIWTSQKEDVELGVWRWALPGFSFVPSATQMVLGWYSPSIHICF